MGVWGQSPQRGPGAEPRWGSGGKAPWSWKLFVHFYAEKWPKVKDLSENLPPCLSRPPWPALSFGQWGAATWSTHSWICHWFVSLNKLLAWTTVYHRSSLEYNLCYFIDSLSTREQDHSEDGSSSWQNVNRNNKTCFLMNLYSLSLSLCLGSDGHCR